MKRNILMAGHRQITWEAPDNPGAAGAGSEPAVVQPDPASADPAPAEGVPDFSWVPDTYKSDTGYDFAKLREDLETGTAAQARLNEQLSAVPESADGYDFTLPDDIDLSDIEGLPEGFSVKALTDHEVFKPLYSQLGEVLHKHGAPAGMAKDVMGLLARYKAVEVAQNISTGKAELEKLPNWQSRLPTLQRALEARLPAEMAEAVKGMTTSSLAVQALEKLVSPGGPRTSPQQPAAQGLNDVQDPYERLKRARGAA